MQGFCARQTRFCLRSDLPESRPDGRVEQIRSKHFGSMSWLANILGVKTGYGIGQDCGLFGGRIHPHPDKGPTFPNKKRSSCTGSKLRNIYYAGGSCLVAGVLL